jgi:hypothetical protein
MALLNTWASQQDQATLSPLSRLLNNYIQKSDAPLAYLMRGDAQGLLKDLNTPKPVNMTQDMTNAALNLNPVMGLIGATAYHGSPAIFDKFDIKKLGSGEGAQSYGHGMYFAENPAVAKQYTTAGLSTKAPDRATEFIIRAKEATTNDEAAKQFLQKRLTGATDDVKPYLQQALSNFDSFKGGNLYKVDIPDESMPKMLNWDMPMNKQNPEVLKALKIPTDSVQRYNQITDKLDELQFTKGGLDSPEWKKLTEEASKIRNKYGLGRTGEELYTEAARLAYANKNNNPSKVAAESLLQQGITGIRYLDQGSRQTGGTSNYVVFDPSQVKILEKGLLGK